VGRTIKLLGEPAILGADEGAPAVRGHQAWALLARVLLSRTPPDRRTLAAELFPDTVDPLGALRWCLASVRRALDCSECLSGDPIEARLPADVTVDALSVDREDFQVEAAGPLLGGIEPRSGPAFSTWLLLERERIAGLIEARIRQDTMRALAVEDHDRAVRIAGLGVRRAPLDEGAHILLVKSLALAGRHDAALAHVEATEAVFLEELGEKPSPALRSAARRTISSPPPGISPGAFVTSLIQAGLAALAAGAADAGLDNLRRATQDAERIGDAALLARATLELGAALVHAVRGYDHEGAVLLRRSTELARRSGSARIATSAFRELGYVEALAGRRPTAAAYLDQAIAIAEDRAELAGVHAVIGFNLVDWGRVADGIGHYETALEHARAAGHRRREIWSLGVGARGLLAAGRLADADAWLGRCLDLVEEQRWIAFRPWAVAMLGESKVRQATEPDGLRPGLEEAFALSCQLRDPCWEGAVGRTLALTYEAAGALEPAMSWLALARRSCQRDSDTYSALHVEILANQAAIARRQGRPELARNAAREWASLAVRNHMDLHVERATAFIGAL
jgi:DNA-binding SARP family transcriptional activator